MGNLQWRTSVQELHLDCGGGTGVRRTRTKCGQISQKPLVFLEKACGIPDIDMRRILDYNSYKLNTSFQW